MRILVWLEHSISVFSVSDAQVARLAERLPQHQFTRVTNQNTLLAELPDADAAVVWSFEREWYARAPRLRYLFTPAAGRERLAPDPAGRIELGFGAFHGRIMAESLLGMMLFLNRRFGHARERQLARDWDRQAYVDTRCLSGQSALLVGYGAIGRHAARLLGALGMRVFGLKRDTRRGAEGVARLFSLSELPLALALADHVVCLAPGDTNSDGLLGVEAFAHMKPGSFIYNLGRGNTIDLGALEASLRSGHLGGAFLDVLPEEPLPAASPIWSIPNLYLTPHASAISREYLDFYFEELASRPELKAAGPQR